MFKKTDSDYRIDSFSNLIESNFKLFNASFMNSNNEFKKSKQNLSFLKNSFEIFNDNDNIDSRIFKKNNFSEIFDNDKNLDKIKINEIEEKEICYKSKIIKKEIVKEKRNFVMKNLIYNLKIILLSEKIKEKKSLIKELSKNYDKDELSLKRRLYDALNVLVSSNIISKIKDDKKTYFSINYDLSNKNKIKKIKYLDNEIKIKINKKEKIENDILEKKNYLGILNELIVLNKSRNNMKIIEFKNIKEIKINREINDIPKIKLPFIIVKYFDENDIEAYNKTDNIIKIKSKSNLILLKDKDFIKNKIY